MPLYFLQRNGWHGQVVGLGYSFLSNEDHLEFGACIGKAISDVGRPVALIASGDLSHRLKPEAPAGYNPTAYIFDDEVVDALRANDPDRIVRIDQDLRRLAGECGYRSMLIAVGATREVEFNCEVLSYEAPFGVGYMVAQLTSRTVTSTTMVAADGNAETSILEGLPTLARNAVESLVKDGVHLKPTSTTASLSSVRAACFVSLKTLAGELRGCMGTIEPACGNLAEEVIANAINAAMRDPRFFPVTAAELPNLQYSVDVLAPPEPATMGDLDPAIYGVIVEDESGDHRGLLLPDLAGIDTAEKQVEIASHKAGILANTPVKLFRFRVDRYRE